MTTRGAEPLADGSLGRESFADEAFATAEAAYARAPGSWELAIQAAIASLFDFLADHPAQTSACMVNGASGLERRDHTIDRFVQLLRPGFTAQASPPPVVAEAIGGGIYELIRNHARERRLEALPDAAPDATIVALSPFMGADDAIQLATSASGQ